MSNSAKSLAFDETLKELRNVKNSLEKDLEAEDSYITKSYIRKELSSISSVIKIMEDNFRVNMEIAKGR